MYQLARVLATSLLWPLPWSTTPHFPTSLFPLDCELFESRGLGFIYVYTPIPGSLTCREWDLINFLAKTWVSSPDLIIYSFLSFWLLAVLHNWLYYDSPGLIHPLEMTTVVALTWSLMEWLRDCWVLLGHNHIWDVHSTRTAVRDVIPLKPSGFIPGDTLYHLPHLLSPAVGGTWREALLF